LPRGKKATEAIVSEKSDDPVAFVVALARAARDEGIKILRVGDIHLEMVVVRNPLAEEAAQAAAKQTSQTQVTTGDGSSPKAGWMDAMGNAEPVLKRVPVRLPRRKDPS
jgi:hypothetical protein